jgi:hypothetical protein
MGADGALALPEGVFIDGHGEGEGCMAALGLARAGFVQT